MVSAACVEVVDTKWKSPSILMGFFAVLGCGCGWEKPVSMLRSGLRPRGSEDCPLRHDPEGIAKRGVA
jgi:hypothetical protein